MTGITQECNVSNIKSAPCLARIVAPGNIHNGWIVSVMHAEPAGEYKLPDQQLAFNRGLEQCWICRSLMHSDFLAPIKVDTTGSKWKTRKTRYAAIEDRCLRPLPGIEDPTQVDERIPESEAA